MYVALAIHAMSFVLQNIILLDRQVIVLIHMPNCRTGAEQSKGSRCEKMLLHLCLPQTDLAAITETLRRFIRVPLWRPPYRRSFPTQSQKFGLNPNRGMKSRNSAPNSTMILGSSQVSPFSSPTSRLAASSRTPAIAARKSVG